VSFETLIVGVTGGVAVDPEPSGVHDVEVVKTSHLPVVAPQLQMKSPAPASNTNGTTLTW
jgi:hypothetical protein